MAATKRPRAEPAGGVGDAAAGNESAARLAPYQTCFVVDDVERAAAECATRFGWGPFRSFSATVEDLDYKGRPARREAEVSLGMAGQVQVELLHVHEGVDCLAAFQARHGSGLQHLGIDTPSREGALARLEALGARLDHRDEFEGIRIAFVDVPNGPGLFELVDRTSGTPAGGGAALPEPGPEPRLAIDRATLVAERMDAALEFFANAFDWRDVAAESATLRFQSQEVRLLRARGQAGRLEIELIEGRPGLPDPYSRHLARGGHGLVHAGGTVERDDPAASLDYQWLETGERFGLLDWSGGSGTLQIRLR